MKKIIFLLLLCVNGFSQEVSPYYPAKNVVNDPYDFTSQLTYFDSNYITNNISEFLTYRLNMVLVSSDDSKLLHEGGKLTHVYNDRISQSGNEKLIISYDIGKVDNVFVIKSAKVSGGKERVYDFFIEFWQTAINFKSPAKGSDVSLMTGQDVVKLSFSKGNPTISITNGTYKNIEEFSAHFAKLKADKISISER